jgi:hypothetical protein
MPYAVVNLVDRKIFRPIKVEEVLQETLINVPEFKEKKSKKYSRKVNRILNKKKVSNIVLCNKLLSFDQFKNALYENNKYIITGKRLFKALSILILKDISNLLGIAIEKLNLAIFTNEYSIENLDLIEYICQNVKNLTIVTENTNRFSKLSENLFEKYGITIKVTDNFKTNLKRINVIINIDFTLSDLKTINIPKECIFISMYEKLTCLKNNFNGIIINNLDILLPKKIDNIDNMSLCEAYIYNYLKNISENEKLFEKSQYSINGYIGSNGKITEQDFERLSSAIKKNTEKSGKKSRHS